MTCECNDCLIEASYGLPRSEPVSRKHGPKKLKLQFSRNEVQVSADLGWKLCGKQTLHHQPPLVVRRNVVVAQVVGESTEQFDVLFSKGSFRR